ncbi:MAG: aldo/keto reductase [Peptococcaceae bacterium]|nr:aldo/keto reductase [Peptococcaceae bacterium]
MQYELLGGQGNRVSRLGFGAMRLPQLADGKVDREKTTAMIDYAYRHGVNYYDTAYVYHGGESEVALGEALSAYPRSSFCLTDKLPIWFCKTEGDAPRIFAEQLKRCRTDYFDYYLLHSMDRERWLRVNELGALDFLDRMKKEGAIKNLGFSAHTDAETLEMILAAYPWDLTQLQLNYVDYTQLDMKRQYEAVVRRGLPCVVMEPLRGGFLAALPADLAAPLTAADGGEASCASWGFRWCISHEHMRVILSGMNTLEQVRENVAIFEAAQALNQQEMAALEQVSGLIVGTRTVPCTGCAYCMDCPAGVNIPAIFAIYNRYMLYKVKFRSKSEYYALPEKARGSACQWCGVCVSHCPQGIAIPVAIEKAHDLLYHLDSRWQVALED